MIDTDHSRNLHTEAPGRARLSREFSRRPSPTVCWMWAAAPGHGLRRPWTSALPM